MSIYEKPILFAVTSAVVILIGTIVTVFIPMLMPQTQPISSFVKPYTAIEQEGRDIYIREGCNNCHTQTVRPLKAEVLRYGEYSKPDEFYYDRPHLWGSRRTGPDLDRLGGKYPDAWHYKHLADPRSMFPRSNMPAYAWLAQRALDTSLSVRKSRVLDFGYSPEEVTKQVATFKATVTADAYKAAKARALVTPEGLRQTITEMDALIAYLQKLGTDVQAIAPKTVIRERKIPPALAEKKNPFANKPEAAKAGAALFEDNCSACHDPSANDPDIPDLFDSEWKHGSSDGAIFTIIDQGFEDGGMPAFHDELSEEERWQIITYIREKGAK